MSLCFFISHLESDRESWPICVYADCFDKLGLELSENFINITDYIEITKI